MREHRGRGGLEGRRVGVGTEPACSGLSLQARQYPLGRSMTEMEVMQFLNRDQGLRPSAQALIYLRDSSFLKCLPGLPLQQDRQAQGWH